MNRLEEWLHAPLWEIQANNIPCTVLHAAISDQIESSFQPETYFQSLIYNASVVNHTPLQGQRAETFLTPPLCENVQAAICKGITGLTCNPNKWVSKHAQSFSLLDPQLNNK